MKVYVWPDAHVSAEPLSYMSDDYAVVETDDSFEDIIAQLSGHFDEAQLHIALEGIAAEVLSQ